MNEKKVKRVEFVPTLPGMQKAVTKKIKRVAVYARVSTDHMEQQTSLAAQKDYYAKKIAEHDDWILAGIYADDGISGTSYMKREAFRKMMADCEDGKIDMILTKSVSRFARNTVDALNSIRKLKALQIGVFFEKESIWTVDSKGEFLITLMTSLAQEESRSISENVAWGHRKKFSDGGYSVGYSKFLGYDYGFEINDEEARLVRRIYRMFLQGYTPYTISLKLTQGGVLTPSKMKKWSASTGRSILTNEKYKGDALLQKEFTVDFLTHRQRKNQGELPQYYVENGHEAIIAPWLFDHVQEKLRIRKKSEYRYSGVNIYSSKLVCGKCGAYYGPKPEHPNDKYYQLVWMCHNRFKKGMYCKNTRIYDENSDGIVCRIAAACLRRKKSVREICERAAGKAGCPELAAEIIRYKGFTAADMDDMAIIIEKIVVDPEGRITAYLIDGTKISTRLKKRRKQT